MDPLSIPSVAAATVQFLDFGTRLSIETRETYMSSVGLKRKKMELSAVAKDVKSRTNGIVRASEVI